MSSKGLLENEVRTSIRRHRYSYRPEQSYLGGYSRVAIFHGNRHPSTRVVPQGEAF